MCEAVIFVLSSDCFCLIGWKQHIGESGAAGEPGEISCEERRKDRGCKRKNTSSKEERGDIDENNNGDTTLH